MLVFLTDKTKRPPKEQFKKNILEDINSQIRDLEQTPQKNVSVFLNNQLFQIKYIAVFHVCNLRN